ncbi:MAG TPA: hypothetical protein VF173_01375 [Thermoanaerobaculia bacterium]|nr:hypothetical protein [Thermoanaerobaculia bacterium]
MNRTVLILAALALLTLPALAFAQSDFDRYVDEIRKSGMSEDAAGSIRMAAGMLSGATIFTVTKEPDGNLGHSYMSATCMRPTKDEATREKQRALREKIEAQQELWVTFLKKQADTDGSGFVTKEEGWALRRLVELGLTAAQVKDFAGVDDLARAVHQERPEVLRQLAAFAKLQADFAAAGLEGAPVLPKQYTGLKQAAAGAAPKL